ncbi:ribonuclease YeeF family protein [Bacillus swezeyi]|uniref:ribonuclease YeeF family protein n=1 Tax=Bacillus swezeyi TaxID=1925020 RepID=UPI0027DC7C94|nr:LXG domain-containing protein [Bacillus swezeyi]
MKTLDVQAFQNGLDKTLTELKNQEDDISKVKQSVKGITSLDDALKGAGGEAIRSFYEECHTTFLLFYESFISDYKGILEKAKSALSSLEPTENGFISQSFLENELHDGVSQAESLTARLTAKANQTAATVSHIVDLPDLDDSAVNENAKKAQRQISETIEKIHTFDREQTNALKTARKDLDTMKQYIEQLEKMYTGPRIEIQKYSSSVLKKEPAFQNLFSELKKKKTSSTKVDDIKNHKSKNSIKEFYGVGSTSSNEKDMEFEFKTEVSGGFGVPGAGNASLSATNKDYEVKIHANASLFDTNKGYKDKGEDEKETYFQLGDIEAEIGAPYNPDKFVDNYLSNSFMGGKMEANGIKVNFDHENSPARVGLDFGHAEAGAGIEDYGASIGASASLADVEVVVSPFNWNGYKPLEEWFGWDYNPYIGVEFTVGGAGVEAKVGTETELKVAAGVGIGLKLGAEKDE